MVQLVIGYILNDNVVVWLIVQFVFLTVRMMGTLFCTCLEKKKKLKTKSYLCKYQQ